MDRRRHRETAGTAYARPATRLRSSRTGQPEAVRLELLGGFRVAVGSRTVGEEEWRLRKAGSLVKLLALARGHRLHREQVLDLLWPELSPEAAANNLHRTLHFARRVLEPAPATAVSRYLSLRGELLALCPGGQLRVDAEAFESAAAAARRSREPAAYRAAVELYAGDLLPEDRYEQWAENRRRELRTVYLTLLVELAALYEDREEPGPAIETLQKAVATEHTHEEAHARLVRLYAASGHEQEALRQYRRLRQALAEEPDREPGAASRRLYEEVLAGRIPRSASAPSGHPAEERRGAAGAQHNLPNPCSSFVGREREMAEVRRTLATSGLLTLTGTGGCGKTRLALEVAKDLAGAYPDGVWLVELASLSDPALVPQAVASALGVREQPGRSMTGTLANHLASRRPLLVLDNCEHLIDACARLAGALLSSCEHLRILATSREILGVAGETNLPVLPLAVPDAEHSVPVEELTRCEAARLFVDRARSRRPGFTLNPQNVRAVARVCRKLDGVPLAIELAAARVTALAVEQVAARLENALELLNSGNRTAERRHQTLRATLEWSHRLLSERERELFGLLSIFAGGWGLEAAEAVVARSGLRENEVLDLLSALVDKSLVLAEASPGAGEILRYRMLEPVRQYARERLWESGEEERAGAAHASYYLSLAETAEPELLGPRPVAWLERLETEHGNLRAALGWFLDESPASGGRAGTGLRLAAALGRFWNTYGPGEGRGWLERGLARSDAAPSPLRARALRQAGFIAIFQGDPRALALLEKALTLSRELGDESELAISISSLGHAVAHAGDHERLRALREEAGTLLRSPLKRPARAHLLLFLAVAAMSQGDPERATARTNEALFLFRELEDIRHVAMSLGVAGISALEQGNPGRAERLFEEDLGLLRELRDKTGIVYGLLGMAGVAALRDHPARASRLWGASEILRETFGLPLTPMVRDHYDYEGYLAAARAGLDEASFEAAWSEGRAMSPEQALEYALGAEEPAPPAPEAPPAERSLHPLTPRQREVAFLVARGLTNRQVAAELSLSEHTVATHVRGILRKLGLRSRTELAAWVTEQGHFQ